MAIVLCIDDHAEGLAVCTAVLEAKGYTVLVATDGQTGIKLAEQRPDVVVLDYQMPGMDGSEVAAVLKSRYPKLPIILFTGFSGNIPEKLLECVDVFIGKGESPAALLSVLEKLGGASSDEELGKA